MLEGPYQAYYESGDLYEKGTYGGERSMVRASGTSTTSSSSW